MKMSAWMIALALQIGVSAHAATLYLDCDNCSESRYQALAAGEAANNQIADVYVADVTRETLRRYSVMVESEPGMQFSRVVTRTPSASELAQFEAYIAARDQLIRELGLLDFTIEVPQGHPVASAYDLWGSNQNRLLIREHINAELSFLERAFSDFFATGSFLLDRRSSHILVQVDFPDGSAAFFELAGKMQDLVWEYRVGQSIDADGNLIPDSLSAFADYAGLFSAQNVLDFLMRAALYNIPITDHSSGSGRVAVVCITDSNGEFSCVVSPVL
ncbi:MAG: hypothetical protein HKN59_06555 [Gammaproteobacteria bacterium]|nr:hypothetical protein [Gammaproteobacteria bacterium]